MEIIKLPHGNKPKLNVEQFYAERFPKLHIFLHHTVSTTVESAIHWWNKKPDHIATPYLIDRDGKVYEAFNPEFWSYALGVKQANALEKSSIHIELVNLGPLINVSDHFEPIAIPFLKVNDTDVVAYNERFRGNRYYQWYTNDQVESLKKLLVYLMNRFKIQKQQNIWNFWEYREGFNKNPNLIPSGIWSHTTIRKDKSDIHPQKNLIEMIYGL